MIKPGDHVAVTGGSGFIGRYLLAELGNLGYRTVSIGRGPSADRVTDYSLDSLSEALEGVDAVVHLAGRRMLREDAPNDLTPFVEPNILAVASLAKAAKACGVSRIVFASTIGVYLGGGGSPFSESQLVCPVNAYGLSKLSAEAYLEMWARNTNISVITLRLAAVYGYGERGTPVLMKFINQAIAGETLRVLGNPTYPIDQLYIKDAVSAFLAALKFAEAAGTFNIGGGCSWRLEEIARTVNAVFDNSENIEIADKPYLALPVAHMNITKAETELRWTPRFDLRAGLQDFKSTLAG